MKPHLVIGLLIIGILIAIWHLNVGEQTPPNGKQIRSHKEGVMASDTQSSASARTANHSSPARLPFIQAKEESYSVDYSAVSRFRDDVPYRFVGGQMIPGKVINQEGKVIIESGREMVIDGAVIGPDKKHVLVKGAEGNNLILAPQTGIKFKLPVRPPGANMFPLDWDWIGEQSLLGESGVERLGPDGKPVSADDNVAESKLYIYNFNTQQLSEVILPDKFTHAVFGVIEVIPDGHVHLALEGSEYRSWCKITTP
jgi:hypothetical protein